MSEILFRVNVPQASFTPSTAYNVDINVPPPIVPPWTVLAVPRDSGAAPAVSLRILRLMAGLAEEIVGTTVLTDNVANTFDRTEPAYRIRVELTPGATIPDGGVDLQLIGTRA